MFRSFRGAGATSTLEIGYYIKSGWNLIDICASAMVLASTVQYYWAILMLQNMEDDAEYAVEFTLWHNRIDVCCAWTVIVLSLDFLNYLRPYTWSGHLISMLTQIMADMLPFLVLQAIFLFSFSLAFMIMVEEFSKDQFGVTSRGFLVGFEMLLSSFSLDRITCENRPRDAQGKMLDQECEATEAYAAVGNLRSNNALAAFCLYMLLAVIINQNLLIAIMGDSYDRIRENSTVHRLRARGLTLCEQDRLIQKPLNLPWVKGWVKKRVHNYFPVYLHALCHGDIDVKEHKGEQWEGRIKALQRTFEGNFDDLKKVKIEVHSLRKEVESLRHEQDLRGSSSEGDLRQETAEFYSTIMATMDEMRADMAGMRGNENTSNGVGARRSLISKVAVDT